jgi:RES domain-containing protein
MAAKSAKLPQPPLDLASRKLPLTRFSGRIYRIHQSKYSALFFGKDGSCRFDDPLQKYGVLYGSLKPEAAFAEVFLRRLDQILIEEDAIRERSLGEIRLQSLAFVDLTGAGLRRLSCDNRIATEVPYRTTSLWSRALFEHPQKPAGIIYRSRHNPKLKCIAIFSTFSHKLKLTNSTNLLARSLTSWTVHQIARYDLFILPSSP